MIIVNKKAADLIPYANNTRTHSDKQVMQIASSIKEFGFTNPVLIDQDGGIIAGHGRVMAAVKLKMDEVPCIELSHLTKAQKKAYIIADNKLALNAGWDEDLLKLEIQNLIDEKCDISILGFDENELAKLFNIDEEIEKEDGTEGFTETLEMENNYIVLKFNNDVDWLQAQTVFGIKSVVCLSTRKDGFVTDGMKRIGVGRVVDGALAINKLLEK
jgi:hypothetical protein